MLVFQSFAFVLILYTVSSFHLHTPMIRRNAYHGRNSLPPNNKLSPELQHLCLKAHMSFDENLDVREEISKINREIDSFKRDKQRNKELALFAVRVIFSTLFVLTLKDAPPHTAAVGFVYMFVMNVMNS